MNSKQANIYKNKNTTTTATTTDRVGLFFFIFFIQVSILTIKKRLKNLHEVYYVSLMNKKRLKYAIIFHVCRFRIDFGNMYAKMKCECYWIILMVKISNLMSHSLWFVTTTHKHKIYVYQRKRFSSLIFFCCTHDMYMFDEVRSLRRRHNSNRLSNVSDSSVLI